MPKDDEDQDRESQLVERRRKDHGVGRIGANESVLGHVDTPGGGRVDAVVAVARGEAAYATDSVAERSGGSCKVEHAKGAYASALSAFGKALEASLAALEHQHGDAGKHAPEPGKAGLEPVQEAESYFEGAVPPRKQDGVEGSGEFGGILQLMPQFGADDAGKGHESDDVESVCVDAVAHEVAMQHDCAANCSEPKEQAEGAQVQGAKVDVGIHESSRV